MQRRAQKCFQFICCGYEKGRNFYRPLAQISCACAVSRCRKYFVRLIFTALCDYTKIFNNKNFTIYNNNTYTLYTYTSLIKSCTANFFKYRSWYSKYLRAKVHTIQRHSPNHVHYFSIRRVHLLV